MKFAANILKAILIGCALYLIMTCTSCKTPEQQCRDAYATLQKNGCLKSDTTKKDTTIYSYAYRDTVIFREKDSATAKVKNPCDQNGKLKPINVTYKNKSATVNLKSDTATNEITATATCDELELKIRLQDKIISHYRETIIQNSFKIEPSLLDKLKNIWYWLLIAVAVGFSAGVWMKSK